MINNLEIDEPILTKYGMDNSIHGYFDETGALPESYALLLEKLLETRPGKIFVDMGAGTGEISERLEKSGMRTIPIDYSPLGFKKTNISGITARADSVPLAENTVDYVHAKDMIEHLDPQEFIAFINESKRLLKSGGRLIITEKNYFSKDSTTTEPWVEIGVRGSIKKEIIGKNESAMEAFNRINIKYGGGTVINAPYFPRRRKSIENLIQQSDFILEKKSIWRRKSTESDWFFDLSVRSVLIFQKT